MRLVALTTFPFAKSAGAARLEKSAAVQSPRITAIQTEPLAVMRKAIFANQTSFAAAMPLQGSAIRRGQLAVKARISIVLMTNSAVGKAVASLKMEPSVVQVKRMKMCVVGSTRSVVMGGVLVLVLFCYLDAMQMSEMGSDEEVGCTEGAACSTTFNECIVPDIIFGWAPAVADIVENMCLGIRRQLEKGIPYTFPNSQILEYGGSPVSTANRAAGPCGPGSCCSGQTNSAGDDLECDEYPFANAYEGGIGAWAACVSEHSNGAQGDLLSQFLLPRHPGFKYEVVITGIDCTTVPQNANPGLNANCPCCS